MRGARNADASDIVVTGTVIRTPVRRGDWNACTVNDPSRSLSSCRRLVDPGARGMKGEAAAHIADGLTLAWAGEYERAVAAFDQAIDADPRSTLAYLNRGLARQRLGEADKALTDLDRAVRYGPGARSYYNRSLALRQRGDTRRADADAQRAVELDSRYEAVVE